MVGFFRWVLAVHTALFVLLLSTGAIAQPKTTGAIHILTFDSDEAEDQAEALSTALRSKVRATAGWNLAETSSSLSMLTAALKCPQKPDAACLQKISDQIKSDKFVWGMVSKGAKGQLNAEAHLWTRGKPEIVARESFSDNLKDPNDDSMKRLAGHLWDKLSGTISASFLLVHAGDGEGSVLVDNVVRGQLDHGQTKIEVAPGTHVIEVRATGFQPSRQSVAVAGGADAPVTLTLVADAAKPVVEPPHEAEKSGSGRKILAYSVIGVGVVAGVVAVIEAAHWGGLQTKIDADRQGNYGVGGPVVADPCNVNPSTMQSTDACSLNKDAKTSSALAWI
ncbi:MAG: carboxypeptidase-like regulatory domain-containing protein, partial [Polyangiaceae bacterium]